MGSVLETKELEAGSSDAFLPERLRIRCGDIVGEYMISLGRVLYGGDSASSSKCGFTCKDNHAEQIPL